MDHRTGQENRRAHPELPPEDIVDTDIVDDGFVLRSLDARSIDFLIANHALEHSPDPVGTLARWRTKLRPGGHLLIAVPVASKCFDRDRAITSLAHLWEDHERFLAGDTNELVARAMAHVSDFLATSAVAICRDNGIPDPTPEHVERLASRVRSGLVARLGEATPDWAGRMRAHVQGVNGTYDVHYHTFSPTSFAIFVDCAARELGFHPMALAKSGGGEVITVLRRH